MELVSICNATNGKVLVDTASDCKDARLLKQRDIAISKLKNMQQKPEHGSLEYKAYCHHYIFKRKILYLLICSKYYPTKLALHFLEEISTKFEKISGVKTMSAGGTSQTMITGTLKDFWIAIKNARKFYASTVFQINSWTSVVRCSDGTRFAEIFDDEVKPEMKNKYSSEAVSMFLEKTETPLQLSVIMGPYSAHCLTEEGICYITICSKQYPDDLVFEYLKVIKNEFQIMFGSMVPYAKTHGIFCRFGSFLSKTVNMYWDTRSVRVVNVDGDESCGMSDGSGRMNDANVRMVQPALEDLNDKSENPDNNVSDQDLNEASSPLKMAATNIKGAQDVEENSCKAQFFRMEGVNGRSSFELDQHIYDDLFPHQREALGWFWSLHCQEKGGILADDMGLGKTRLILAFLVGLFHSKLIKRALIIVPKTIVEQWDEAIHDIGLGKELRIYTSAKLKSHQQGLEEIAKEGGLLVSSYQVVRAHHQAIVGDITWDYMFFDEGHRLKNFNSKTSQALNATCCCHKIIATGTPIQNNLLEYYAIINICCPGMLGSETSFREKFSYPIEKGKHKDATVDQLRTAISVTEELNKLVAPYLLRRTKRILVETKRLPKKQELTVWLQMTPLQVRLYEKFVKIPNFKIGGAGLAAAQVAREICNHPLILKHSEEPRERKGLSAGYVKKLLRLIPVEDDVLVSCKILFLLHLVPHLLKQKHKILIFSQSCAMLKIAESTLRDVLGLAKNEVMRMDGATLQEDRELMINAFQPDDKHKKSKSKASQDNPYKGALVFLMTTYVGGVGLNLTNATRVIIIDPAKNPSTDNQSVDRAYRLGQKHNVVVYRLMTCGTIEEHTYREQILKGEMSSALVENKNCKRSMARENHRVLIVPEGGFDKSVTHADLKELFSDDSGFRKSPEIRLARKHKLVFGISNHSLLFTKEEDLSLTSEDLNLTSEGESSRRKATYHRTYQKKKSEVVIDGEKYALEPNSEMWPMYSGPKSSKSRTRLSLIGREHSDKIEAKKAAEPGGSGQGSRHFDPGKDSFS